MKYLFIIAMEKEASDIIEHYKLNKIIIIKEII